LKGLYGVIYQKIDHFIARRTSIPANIYINFSIYHQRASHYAMFLLVHSPLLGPNILLSSLFLNSLNPWPSIRARGQDLQIYKTAVNIVTFYFNLCDFR
jgi:hypothetical protein